MEPAAVESIGPGIGGELVEDVAGGDEVMSVGVAIAEIACLPGLEHAVGDEVGDGVIGEH
ncbi:MAG: hypothetical protein RI897_3299 [Verrucomicrobiota bacterium]